MVGDVVGNPLVECEYKESVVMRPMTVDRTRADVGVTEALTSRTPVVPGLSSRRGFAPR